MQPTPRFTAALIFAAATHRKQKKKGTKIPYMAHLLGVTSIVLEHGGDEDQAIAALLHDAIEDQLGGPGFRKIEAMFGRRVREIVDACTDSYEIPKPPWRQRKEKYLRKMKTKSADALLVSLADKVYNVQAILRDVKRDGTEVWSRFRGRKKGTLWYYRALVGEFGKRKEFRRGRNSSLLEELDTAVRELETIAGVRR